LVVDESNRQNNTRSDLGANEYKLAFESLVLPLANEFKPDVVIISCGFDAGIGDPIGWSRLSPLMYFWMTHQLCKVCDKIIVVQEGGYNTDYMKLHAEGVIKGLIVGSNPVGHDLDKTFGPPTTADVEAGLSSLRDINSELARDWAKANIEETIKHLRPFWKCL
jgi:hypothetical protein